MQPTFTLTEQSAFGSQYSWELKVAELRFDGLGKYRELGVSCIPVSENQITSFIAALDFLQLWEWRNDYDAKDVGLIVRDGSWWEFSAAFGERVCQCSGVNAYPSYANPKQTTMDGGRFALLRAAMYDCFEIDVYIEHAKH